MEKILSGHSKCSREAAEPQQQDPSSGHGLGLGKQTDSGPQSHFHFTASAFHHTNCRLGLQSQPPDKNGQGSGKAQTLSDPRPQGLDDRQSGPLSW